MIVWIASYPRSGNTFLRVLFKHAFNLETYSLHGDSYDIAADPNTASIVGHRALPDGFDFTTARDSKELFIIKTHNDPLADSDKTIYLVRDGRESVVSYWHYLRRFAQADVSLEDVIYGNVRFGLWADHVQNWNPTCRLDTLVLKFEDITLNPASSLELISEFLELPIRSRQLPTFGELQKVNERFFRKGAVDSWRQEMTQEQELKFWLLNIEQMASVYPEQAPPSELTDLSITRVQTILKEQGTILRSSNRDLQEKFTVKSKETAGLRRELIDIKHQAKQLADINAIRAPIKKAKVYKRFIRKILGTSP